MIVTFSESVTGFTDGDLNVSGGSVSNFSGSGTTYTFNFTPTSNATGTFTINIPAGIAQGSTANDNSAATQYSKTYFRKTPTITGATPTSDTTPTLTVANIISSLTANIYSDSACSTSMGSAASTGISKTVTSSSISVNTTYYADVTDAQGNKSACSSVFALTYRAITYSSIHTNIIAVKCSGCHTGAVTSGRNFSNYSSLMASGAVSAGNASASSLYTRVNNDSMPQGGPALSTSEKTDIQAWINGGANND